MTKHPLPALPEAAAFSARKNSCREAGGRSLTDAGRPLRAPMPVDITANERITLLLLKGKRIVRPDLFTPE